MSTTTIQHINPEGVEPSPFFSQAVAIPPGATLVFIGGQNGKDASGEVASDDAGEQSVQALANVVAAVEAAGGKTEDIVKWNVAVTDRASLGPGFGAFQQLWGDRSDPPAVTVSVVAGLGDPQFLVEIEAVAAIA